MKSAPQHSALQFNSAYIQVNIAIIIEISGATRHGFDIYSYNANKLYNYGISFSPMWTIGS